MCTHLWHLPYFDKIIMIEGTIQHLNFEMNGKWLSRLYSLNLYSRIFVPTAVVLCCGQSRNYLVTPSSGMWCHSIVEIYWYFGGMYYFHLAGSTSKPSKQPASSVCCFLFASCLYGLLIDSEDNDTLHSYHHKNLKSSSSSQLVTSSLPCLSRI
jgi:hypothetical protein